MLEDGKAGASALRILTPVEVWLLQGWPKTRWIEAIRQGFGEHFLVQAALGSGSAGVAANLVHWAVVCTRETDWSFAADDRGVHPLEKK